MLSSVVVSSPKIRDKLLRMRALTSGFQAEAQKVAMRGVYMLQNLTPVSEVEGSQNGEHIADGWDLHVIGGKSKSGSGLLMVIYNRFVTKPSGQLLESARLKVQGVKQSYTLLHILEYGSRAHWIPRKEDWFKGIILRFTPKGSGRERFAAHVRHPGTPAVGMIRITRAKLVDWWKEFTVNWTKRLEREYKR